jgi:hypothetical protein
MANAVTHADLVKRAARWLKNTKHCGVVLTEFHSGSPEVPDAIGWKTGGCQSYLVECKTSVDDFYADSKKPGRNPRARHHLARRAGLGRERYYLAPKGVLDVDRVKRNRPGWGLLEASGRQVRVRLKAIPWDHQSGFREMPLLYSYARRMQEGWIPVPRRGVHD